MVRRLRGGLLSQRRRQHQRRTGPAAAAQSALEPIRRLDDSFEELYQRLEAVYSEVYDLAYTVQDKRDAFDFSPQELDEVEGRLDQLYRLKKKYGPDVESMLAYLDRSTKELDAIEDAGDTLLHLQQLEKKALSAAQSAAEELSKARHQAAERLEEQILTELRQLDMGRIRFAIDFQPQPLSESGMDAVRSLCRQRGRGAAPTRRSPPAVSCPHHAGHEERSVGAGPGRHHGL